MLNKPLDKDAVVALTLFGLYLIYTIITGDHI